MSGEGPDFELFELLNRGVSSHGFGEAVLHFFAVDGELLFVALLVALFVTRGAFGRREVVAACLAAALALLVAQAIGHVWDRPRPFEAHPGEDHLLLPRSPDPSFPSDHATGAFAIGVALLLRDRRVGALTVLLALAVSLSRVALGTHYPGDVLGGATLGALVALVLWTPRLRRPLDGLVDGASSGRAPRRSARASRRPRARPYASSSPGPV